MSNAVSTNPLIQLKIPHPISTNNPLIRLKIPPRCGSKRCNAKPTATSARLDGPQPQKQLDLSVLRFTLGIPGLDESVLPRWIGYGFGSLVVLNHFLGSGSATPAQLRSEALGLSLAAFSTALPYLGQFLKGATPIERATVPVGVEQIFFMSPNVSDDQKEDLAWATYVLLRNTNTTSVLISIQSELCIRGYWNTPSGASKSQIAEWITSQIENTGLSDLGNSLYFPQPSDSGFWEMFPEGTCSVSVEPVWEDPNSSATESQVQGFILLASSMRYAYSDKDRAWIKAIARKFRNKSTDVNTQVEF